VTDRGSRGAHTKPAVSSVLVFGANNYIGRPLAAFIAARDSAVKLRLAIRSEAHRAGLAAAFPAAEIVIADYYDLASLEAALSGVNGVFVNTPNFCDEERAMTNLVYAARRNQGLVHIVRLLGDPAGMTMERVPDTLKKFGGGAAVQHLRARAVLEASGLPVTYVNITAYFMQNLAGRLMNAPLRESHTLIVPRNRRMAWIDTRDIGACGAALLLSDDQRHIDQTYHLDNGHDVLWFDELAALMSEVWGVPIRYDGSDEAFVDVAATLVPRANFAAYFLAYSQFEQDNETLWRKSDIVEYLTGRRATTLRDWLRENRSSVLG
jgi:uncharacterized protein YbjT (DUF2867 family)